MSEPIIRNHSNQKHKLLLLTGKGNNSQPCRFSTSQSFMYVISPFCQTQVLEIKSVKKKKFPICKPT